MIETGGLQLLKRSIVFAAAPGVLLEGSPMMDQATSAHNLPKHIQFGLAPMEGVTELSVRLWFALTSGPRWMSTPFLRVTDTFPAEIPPGFAPELSVLKNYVPYTLLPQLMGPRVEDFCRTADKILTVASFVDLNCGCPSPTVVGNRSGSSLLEKVDVFSEFIEKASLHVGPRRMSVKMRTGYHEKSEFDALVRAIAQVPLAQLTVHGRTRPDRYTGQADWTLIDKASRIVSYTVVGSGDINDGHSAFVNSQFAPLVEAMIIGRGALRNPWIFGDETAVPLKEPLVAFACLQEMGMRSELLLNQFVLEGGVSNCIGGDQGKWRKACEQLLKLLGQVETPWHQAAVSPRAFARVKMLWSYFRSSLPEAFMEPTLLRAKTLESFLEHLDMIAMNSGLNPDLVALSYKRHFDWMYSGQSKEKSKE